MSKTTPKTTGDRIRATLARQQVMQDRVSQLRDVSQQLVTLSAALLALNPERATADTLTNLARGAATIADTMAALARVAQEQER